MKENKKVLVLIILSIMFLIIGLVAKNASKKSDTEENKDVNKCYESSYYLVHYSSNGEELENTVFLKTESDYDKEKRLKESDKKKLNFEEHDYLVYFLEPQNGCEREKRLYCVEYNEDGLALNFEYYRIDPSCDAIYFDAFIIELEKDKYDAKIKVEETLYEVKNEEE